MGDCGLAQRGDGLIHVPEYQDDLTSSASKAIVYAPGKRVKASSYVKWDEEFHVYKLEQSRYMDGFWIGAGNPGLFIIHSKTTLLHPVENPSGQPAIDVHDIYEENDTTLYVVTAGVGFYKMILEKKAGYVRIKEQKRYHFFL